jgi:hypothetical protein
MRSKIDLPKNHQKTQQMASNINLIFHLELDAINEDLKNWGMKLFVVDRVEK